MWVMVDVTVVLFGKNTTTSWLNLRWCILYTFWCSMAWINVFPSIFQTFQPNVLFSPLTFQSIGLLSPVDFSVLFFFQPFWCLSLFMLPLRSTYPNLQILDISSVMRIPWALSCLRKYTHQCFRLNRWTCLKNLKLHRWPWMTATMEMLLWLSAVILTLLVCRVYLVRLPARPPQFTHLHPDLHHQLQKLRLCSAHLSKTLRALPNLPYPQHVCS